jgi:tetratricopeptide (TPR) repeat protein
VNAPARRLVLGLLLVAVAALAGAALWFTDAAEAWRLRRVPLAELEQRAAAGQLDFRGALVLGTRLLNAGRYPEAERQLRKLIEADRDNGAAYAQLGTLLAHTGRQSEAFQVLMIAVNRRPDLPDGHLALGDLYLARQAYPNAIRELRAALRLDPRLDNAWYQLSLCYDELAQPTRAREALEQATRLNPRDDRYQVDLARLLWRHGEPEAARDHLQHALAVNPDSAPAHYTLAEMLLSQPGSTHPELAMAESHLRTALRLAPGYPPARYQLGMLAMRRRQWTAAAAEFEAALKFAPAFKEAIFNLARAYDRQGRAADAERQRARFARLTEQEQQILDLRARIGFGPEDAALYFRLARAYRAAGELDRAYETLVSGLQRAPHDTTARAELRALARLTGRQVVAGTEKEGATDEHR